MLSPRFLCMAFGFDVMHFPHRKLLRKIGLFAKVDELMQLCVSRRGESVHDKPNVIPICTHKGSVPVSPFRAYLGIV